MSEDNQNYWTLLEKSALKSLQDLRNSFPKIYFYFFEPDYYLFFKKIADKNIPDITVVNILDKVLIRNRPRNLSPRQCLDHQDEVLYIGRPLQLLQLCRVPIVKSRVNPVVFASIPLYSHSMRIDIWKTPVNFKSFASLFFPFVPFPHFLQLTCGNFKSLFIREPIYELKAIQTIISSLASIFGKFSRIYSAGKFSTQFSQTLFESSSSDQEGEVKNNLILFDRSVDLISILRIHDSYISFLEEVGAWDHKLDRVDPNKLSQILNIPVKDVERLNLYTPSDPLFEKISLMNLPEALRQINTTEMKKNIPEPFLANHGKVINWLSVSITNGYLIDLVLRIQRNMVDPLEYGRCVPLSPMGPSLAFRMLSILNYNGKLEASQSFARLLACKFGISMFSKWNEADTISMKSPFIQPPNNLSAAVGAIVSPIASLLGHILMDSWKRPKLPVEDSFVSNQEPLPKDKFRWFVGVIGGMTATELRLFKKVAKVCRPNDEFIFMSTDNLSSRQFMDDILH